jgi:hypothetical protein
VAVLLRPGHAPIGPWLRAQPLRRYSHEGATIFILATKRTPQVATLLGPDLLVIGFPDPVEHAAAEIRRSSAPLGENQVLLGLLEGLRADAPLWLAYELRARARPDGLSEDVARAVAQLTTLTMTGRPQAALDLEFTATAETPEAAAALGRLVGQLAGFAPYAAGENPALLDLARSLRTVQQERQLLLSARVPYALLDGFPQQLSFTSALPGGRP